jgi:hypothetical protein
MSALTLPPLDLMAGGRRPQRKPSGNRIFLELMCITPPWERARYVSNLGSIAPSTEFRASAPIRC